MTKRNAMNSARVSSASIVLLIVCSWCGSSPVRYGWASPLQRGRGAGVDVFDPQEFLEQFMGRETEAEKEQMAKIEIGWDDERRFGQQALEGVSGGVA